MAGIAYVPVEEMLIDAPVGPFDNGCTLETPPAAFIEKGFVEWVV